MKTRRYFSLIELLIVIGIMGALAALILPAFSNVERDAKDTACDYNQAGTIRYLKMFQSANGYYPTGFHTGGSGAKAWNTPEDGATDTVTLTTCGTHNFVDASDEKIVGTGETDAGTTKSLVDAGIVTLAYGQGDGAGVVALSGTAVGSIQIKAVKPSEDGVTWTEELDPLTGEVPASPKVPLTFRGVSLGRIAWIGEQTGAPAAVKDKQFKAEKEADFLVVPFYVAPTIDWEHYYTDGGPEDSKISIAMAGKCPWGEDGQARYYIAFFKVYKDGSPAKLLCTSCPDCGILEDKAF